MDERQVAAADGPKLGIPEQTSVVPRAFQNRNCLVTLIAVGEESRQTDHRCWRRVSRNRPGVMHASLFPFPPIGIPIGLFGQFSGETTRRVNGGSVGRKIEAEAHNPSSFCGRNGCESVIENNRFEKEPRPRRLPKRPDRPNFTQEASRFNGRLGNSPRLYGSCGRGVGVQASACSHRRAGADARMLVPGSDFSDFSDSARNGVVESPTQGCHNGSAGPLRIDVSSVPTVRPNHLIDVNFIEVTACELSNVGTAFASLLGSRSGRRTSRRSSKPSFGRTVRTHRGWLVQSATPQLARFETSRVGRGFRHFAASR